MSKSNIQLANEAWSRQKKNANERKQILSQNWTRFIVGQIDFCRTIDGI
jgi:hypothetical protein